MHAPQSAQLVDYLRILLRRWPIVLLLTVLTTGTAIAVSLSGQKQYDASAKLLLRGAEPIENILQAGGGGASSDPERELNTNVELIKVGQTAAAVLRILRINRSRDDLIKQIETTTSSNSNIITLRARDRSPRLAANIANAFVDAFAAERLQAQQLRYDQAAKQALNEYNSLQASAQRSLQGTDLLSRARELQIASGLQTGDAEVVRRASVPTDPSRPRPKLSAAIGLMLGLLLGITAAFALEMFDRRFKDEEAVEAFFQLPLIAVIPRPGRRSRAADDSAQREAFGLLAANLRYSTLRGSSNVLMVTSPSPGDGKTSVTIGLGRALAGLGMNVIAIEADLRRPTFAKHALLGPSAGLTGVLSGTAELVDEVLWLQPTTLKPFDTGATRDGALGVLPSGPLPTNPLRMLSEPGLAVTIEAARGLADVVLVDTPPIGTINDCVPVSHLADAVAVVVRLGKTTKDSSKRAMRVLGALDVRLAGLVLTDAARTNGYGYYSTAPDDGPAVPADVPSG